MKTVTVLALLLALWLLVGLGVTQPLDAPWTAWVVAHRPLNSSPLASVCVIPLGLGVIIPTLAVLWRQQRGVLVGLGLTVAGTIVAVWLFKHAPLLGVWYAGNYPSGHTATGALLCVLLARTLARLPLPPGRTRVLRGACAVAALAVGLLVLFPLGHSPSEVLGGYLLAWVAAAPLRPYLASR